MSTEELLKPRYKVIAPYPNMSNYVGHIYTPDAWSVDDFADWGEWYENYPHLFKKLEWWEERKPEEMPEYVKRGDKVFKIHRRNNGLLAYDADKSGTARLEDWKNFIWLHSTTPATKEEYEAFIKTKEGA